MPTWITHLGLLYFIRSIFRTNDYRLLLIGAILPDITRPVYVLFLDILDIFPVETVVYMEPFHTPFISILLGMAIALFTINPSRSALIIIVASLIHYLVDMTQMQVGYYNLILYPFSFKNLDLNFFFAEHQFYLILTVLFIPFFILMVIGQKRKRIFAYNKKNLNKASLLLLACIILPLLTKGLFIKNNFHYLQFYIDPQTWQSDREVQVSGCNVVKIDPLMIEEMGRKFQVKTDEKLKLGQRISFIANYKNGVFYAKKIYHHYGFQKAVFSALAIIFSIAIFLKKPKNIDRL